MAEIKFSVARMREVNSRLNEITQQVTSSASKAAEEIASISNNITGDEVRDTLKQYQETNEYVIKNTQTQLGELQSYLQQQIVAYSTTEEAASADLTGIQGMLDGIE